MADAKKHHIVPQCVLAKFTGSDGRLARLKFKDKRASANRRFFPAGIGYQPEFYKIHGAEDPLCVENGVNQSYERDFNKFWPFLEQGEDIQFSVKKRICEIMIFFKLRNDYIRKEVFTPDGLMKIAEELQQKSSNASSALYRGINNGPIVLPELLRLVRERGAGNSHNIFLAGNDFHDRIELISKLYLGSHWIVHVTDEANPFIISDNLGITLNENNQELPMTGVFRFFFPISSTHYLEIANLGSEADQSLLVQEASAEYVEELNLATCAFAVQEIYGPSGRQLEAVRERYFNHILGNHI